MRQLKEFRFRWTDAWGNTDSGIDTVLEVKPNNAYEIKMIVNGNPTSVEVNADEFINDFESINLHKWNQYEYSQCIEDGDMWMLSIKYDNTEIYSRGFNGYAPRFLEFLDVLHKHGFPRINLEGVVTSKEIGRSKREKFDHNYSTYADYVYIKGI